VYIKVTYQSHQLLFAWWNQEISDWEGGNISVTGIGEVHTGFGGETWGNGNTKTLRGNN
jgi:hypothetical protein